MRLKTAKDTLRPFGIIINSRPNTGEYRVNFANGREATAYYTDDIEDAVETGKRMAEERASAPVTSYDAKQTAKLARCAEHLRSISVLGVSALSLNGDCDRLADILDDIKRDVDMAIKLNNELSCDNVD